MPTALREKSYRCIFYNYDLNEPVHVHATKAGHEAKVWLNPLGLTWNEGFKQHELREILAITETKRRLIEQKRNERT
jgi:hypothetical protein